MEILTRSLSISPLMHKRFLSQAEAFSSPVLGDLSSKASTVPVGSLILSVVLSNRNICLTSGGYIFVYLISS